jgi:hypothetical protein
MADKPSARNANYLFVISIPCPAYEIPETSSHLLNLCVPPVHIEWFTVTYVHVLYRGALQCNQHFKFHFMLICQLSTLKSWNTVHDYGSMYNASNVTKYLVFFFLIKTGFWSCFFDHSWLEP